MSKALSSKTIKLADLKGMSSTPQLKKYVETLTPFMPSDPNAVVGTMEIREEAGMPVLHFIPELKLINILRPKLTDKPEEPEL